MEKTINKDAAAVQASIAAMRRALSTIPMEVSDAAFSVQSMLMAVGDVRDEELRRTLAQALTKAQRLRSEIDENLTSLHVTLDSLEMLAALTGNLL